MYDTELQEQGLPANRPPNPSKALATRQKDYPMTSNAHSQVVQKQFGEQASAYLSSAVHAQGAEFALLQTALAGHSDARVLDLGCGAGHVSFHVAPLVAKVAAYDLSQQMLDVVGEFDFVFSRYSAHHWSDLGLALREVRRVLKPGGVAAFIDVMSPGSPLFDTYLQTVEVLRDTSHVRDYSAAEWSRGPARAQHQPPTLASGVQLLGRAHAYAGAVAGGDSRPAAGDGQRSAGIF